ncbi:hypothetical protein EAH81_22335 [Flavobacterium pectinovorum]|uniref:Uncharacterized protein n=2 Tax=Flavobacterium pectinovorum TaxID=29533 RepID=A0A502EET1_9FLAO|nr:hypothetical protein EAH81_22335 [Flavobacterium pectinovorum]
MKYNMLILFALLFFSMNIFGQVYTDKIVGKKNEALKDSLEVQKYPYALPIWGEKVAQKGYKLPYSAGISINYFWQESDLDISNLNVGFNNGPQYNLDQIVRFNSSVASANAVNIRPDIWLLPFLNVYGILGKASTSTTINAGIWIPDADNNWSEVTSFSSKANFSATTMGFGITPTIGIGGGWLALDMNMTWTDVDALENPAFAFVFGPRIGKTFKFKKPESNVAVWVGAFRVHLKSETKGSLNLADVLPLEGAQAKVDNGLEKVSENQSAVNNWWNSLSSAQQANPANAAKYNTANKALETAGTFLTAVDGALSTAGSSTVQYSLEKAPSDMWNFIVGGQYQYNKHIMLRAEYGFLGSREQFLTSIQYRFGL